MQGNIHRYAMNSGFGIGTLADFDFYSRYAAYKDPTTVWAFISICLPRPRGGRIQAG
jgi:hypothetical protein